MLNRKIPLQTFLADTNVTSVNVDTSSGTNARGYQSGTLVHILFASVSSPSTGTSASKVILQIMTSATIQTRLRGAFIQISFAAFPGEAILAVAVKIGAISGRQTGAPVETGCSGARIDHHLAVDARESLLANTSKPDRISLTNHVKHSLTGSCRGQYSHIGPHLGRARVCHSN